MMGQTQAGTSIIIFSIFSLTITMPLFEDFSVTIRKAPTLARAKKQNRSVAPTAVRYREVVELEHVVSLSS